MRIHRRAGVAAICGTPIGKPTREIVGGTISPAELFPRPPDAAIVAEPTEFQCRRRPPGRGALAMPHDRPGGPHVAARRRHQRDLRAWRKSCRRSNAITPSLQQDAPLHPLCGRPSVCVSTIHGGVGINTVPERATIEIDRRLGPDEQPETAYDDLIALRRRTRRCRPLPRRARSAVHAKQRA